MDNVRPTLAVELFENDKVKLYYRHGVEVRPLNPWLLVASSDISGLDGVLSLRQLTGQGAFNMLIQLETWSSFLKTRETLTEHNIPFFCFNTPVRQYLVLSGKTLFKAMKYEDIHRVQLDIETLGLDPEPAENRIILIAVSDNKGFEHVIGERGMAERDLLNELNRIISSLDPDVIEGHNLFDFDLSYLHKRAEMNHTKLNWGRDGSELKPGGGTRRYKVGGTAPPYTPFYVHGRHIIDTLQQTQRYDIAGKLESYGLKSVIRQLGLERSGRTFVSAEEIPKLWEKALEQLKAYALDDVRDVKALSELVVPTEFYQTQMLPYTFQETALSGTGEKINALMVGVYLRRGVAIPEPMPSKSYPGGYTEIRAKGVFRRIVKTDVNSLYPSIMIGHRIKPASDTEGIFLPMLSRLTKRRLEAKSRLKASSGTERAYWDGLQGSYKILINSFYGYLGYNRANFSDYDAAEKVTAIGQKIAKQLIKLLEEKKCEVIEVDTDGVYFVSPPGVEHQEDEEQLIEEVSNALPQGITLSHDGRYQGMISLKAKNYVLMDYGGELLMKGSSLRSRRDERFLRRFIEDCARWFIQDKKEALHQYYLDIGEEIKQGKIPIAEFCRRETITERTFKSVNLRRLAQAVQGRKIGEKVEVYQKKDDTLALVEQYEEDEDKDHLLRRLHDAASRFKDLFEDETAFNKIFPLMILNEQLTLF